MLSQVPGLLDQIRDRFAHVDTCPFEGPRVFFENAGGALTLKSVVETSAAHASYPDNQGRDNSASHALMQAIETGVSDVRTFFNAPTGQVFIGESGTEVLFRLVRAASLGAPKGGTMLCSTLEHPASRSAMTKWSENTNRTLATAIHDDASGSIDIEAFRQCLTPDLRVATVVQTSPVTGMSTDVPGIIAAIRTVAPDCFIIVDGIQHASHGGINLKGYDADGFAISPYKVFSRHGYGIGWASDRLTAVPREGLVGAPATEWKLGTRDSGSYATFSDVVDYFAWLGGHFTESKDRRAQIEAAGSAIQAHEHHLTKVMMHGVGNLAGLVDIPGVHIIGDPDSPAREGVVSLTLDTMDSIDLVTFLREQGIRVHIRKNDYYCGNILAPLGLDTCIRVSICHYNTEQEVTQFLTAMQAAANG